MAQKLFTCDVCNVQEYSPLEADSERLSRLVAEQLVPGSC